MLRQHDHSQDSSSFIATQTITQLQSSAHSSRPSKRTGRRIILLSAQGEKMFLKKTKRPNPHARNSVLNSTSSGIVSQQPPFRGTPATQRSYEELSPPRGESYVQAGGSIRRAGRRRVCRLSVEKVAQTNREEEDGQLFLQFPPGPKKLP